MLLEKIYFEEGIDIIQIENIWTGSSLSRQVANW